MVNKTDVISALTEVLFDQVEQKYASGIPPSPPLSLWEASSLLVFATMQFFPL